MQLEWPLILFTTFVAWSAGTFAVQGALAVQGQGRKVQLPALVTSLALLAIGGISVFFHLKHWERIFNGFGTLTSGITHELICIVIMGVIAVVYFALIRKAGDDGNVPAWIGIAAIVISVVLLFAMAHSYMMPARPAWDSFLWFAVVLGNALAFGTLTNALIAALVKEELANIDLYALAGTAIAALAIVAYSLFWQMTGSSAFTDVGYHFDAVNPTAPLENPAALMNVFGGANAALMWVGVIAVGAIAPIACAAFGKKSGNWLVAAGAGLACTFIGAICLRMVFFLIGVSVYVFY